LPPTLCEKRMVSLPSEQSQFIDRLVDSGSYPSASCVNYSVFFTPEAKEDLFDLYDYIADRSSPKRALNCIGRISC